MRRLAVLAAVAVLVVPAVATAAGPVDLSGHLTGAVTDHAGPPDTPTTHELAGSGATNLGPTTVRGSVHGTGFVQYGTCSGRLVLTSTRGSLTLAVSSPRIKAFTECPTRLSWHITSSSGSLRGSTGSGTMHLTTKGGRFQLAFDGPGTSFPAMASTGAPRGLAILAILLLLASWTVRRPRGPLRAG